MKKIIVKRDSFDRANSSQPTAKFAASAKSHPQPNAQFKDEILRLRAQVETLTHELDRCRAELTAAEFGTVMANRQRALEDSFTMVEAQNYTLMNLFVAATRLHTSTHRSGVLTAIREILSDLIGSAASAVFEIDASGKTLSLLESSGIAAATLSHIPIGSGCIGRVAATGEPFFGDGTDGELIACVPLKLGPRVTGVIALFRLLDQKVELHSNDHELLDFISTHAALALHRTAARTGSGLPSGAVS